MSNTPFPNPFCCFSASAQGPASIKAKYLLSGDPHDARFSSFLTIFSRCTARKADKWLLVAGTLIRDKFTAGPVLKIKVTIQAPSRAFFPIRAK
jgi:hypothetical protein